MDGRLQVSVQPIVFESRRLALGPEQTRLVMRHIGGRGFVDEARPSDWVSIHWGWACDRLTKRQLRNLRRHTLWHLTLANQTL
jgi:hypothetical protein